MYTVEVIIWTLVAEEFLYGAVVENDEVDDVEVPWWKIPPDEVVVLLYIDDVVVIELEVEVIVEDEDVVVWLADVVDDVELVVDAEDDEVVDVLEVVD